MNASTAAMASPSAFPMGSSPASAHLRRPAVIALVTVGHALGLWTLASAMEEAPRPPEPAPVVQVALVSPPEAQPEQAQPTPPRTTPQSSAVPPKAPSLKPVRAQAPTAPKPTAESPEPDSSPPLPSETPLAVAKADNADASGWSTQAPPVEAIPAPPPIFELPSSNASYLSNPRPPYPPMSKRLREQGTVLLSVRIDETGKATDAQLKRSSGFERLDEVALKTVLGWRYRPGTRNGVPEPMWFDVPIRFELS